MEGHRTFEGQRTLEGHLIQGSLVWTGWTCGHWIYGSVLCIMQGINTKIAVSEALQFRGREHLPVSVHFLRSGCIYRRPFIIRAAASLEGAM
jgi:hypothetical protein